MLRNVYIRLEPNHHAILIVYADARRARKLYAQFDDRHRTLDDAIAYIKENQLLRLICPLSSKPI